MALLTARGGATTLAAVLLIGTATRAQQVTEQDVKAAFLYNFTRFVEWPAGVPEGSGAFQLCVVADDQTTALIGRTMEGESVNGRAVHLSVPSSPQAAQKCQILFIAQNEMGRGAPLLAAVRELPVLTVGEGDRFLRRGGVIEFVLDAGRVRFDVNIETARRARLGISSRLLQVAREVVGQPR